MFERSRNDYIPEPNSVPVEATLADGKTARAKVLVPAGKSLADVLNGAGGFIEIELYGGERSFLAKERLAWIKPVNVPRAPSLGTSGGDRGGFDPCAILGVRAGASREEVRQAYLRLAKAYHPDRYASIELPEEVRDYLAAMARRINAAHAALDAPRVAS
jgi:DnaJ domain